MDLVLFFIEIFLFLKNRTAIKWRLVTATRTISDCEDVSVAFDK